MNDSEVSYCIEILLFGGVIFRKLFAILIKDSEMAGEAFEGPGGLEMTELEALARTSAQRELDARRS